MEATAAVAASQAAHVLAISSTNNRTIKFASLPTKSAAAGGGGGGGSRTSPITTTSRSSLLSARNLARNPFPTRCYPERDLDSSRSSSTDEESATHHPPPTPSTIDPKLQHPTTSEDALTLPPSSSSSHGLVLDVGPDHSWDNHEVGSPVIKRFVGDDKERWFMWYHGGGSSSSSIGLALSNNGIHWERGLGPVVTGDDVGQAMHRNSDWWAFDTHCIRPSDVLIMSSAKLRAPGVVYWLYYTGFTTEKVEIPIDPKLDVFKSLPGLAISQDGRHWARIEGEHHSGALFDVGAAGNWDSLFVAAPKVVYHGRGDLRMYYHSWDPRLGQYAIGMARSRDGIRWVKLGKVLEGGAAGSFDEGGVMNGHVVRVNGKDDSKAGEYLMAYQGVSADGQMCIGLAVSSDGLKDWRRCRDQAVLKPSMEEEDGWDSRGVGAPCLVQMDGGDEWRLYYGGFDRGGRTGIGLAVSQSDGGTGARPMSFERWTGFHL